MSKVAICKRAILNKKTRGSSPMQLSKSPFDTDLLTVETKFK